MTMMVIGMQFVFFVDIPLTVRFGNFIFTRLPAALGTLGYKVRVFALLNSHETADFVQLPPNVEVYDITTVDKNHPAAEGDYLCLFVSPYFAGASQLKELLQDQAFRQRFKKIVYWSADCWVDWVYRPDVVEVEGFLLSISHIRLANSPQNCVRLHKAYSIDRVGWIPNAASQERWLSAVEWGEIRIDDCLSYQDRYNVLIVSSFHHRKDAKRVYDLATKFRSLRFIVVGKSAREDSNFPPPSGAAGGNVLWVGPQPNFVVKKLLQSALFCVVPSLRSWFAYYSDPTKWYLYHSGGVPILSMNVPHHRRYPQFYPYTLVAFDWEEGIKKMLDALESSKLPLRYKPSQVHDYIHRAKVFLEVLEGDIGYGYAHAGGFTYGKYEAV